MDRLRVVFMVLVLVILTTIAALIAGFVIRTDANNGAPAKATPNFAIVNGTPEFAKYIMLLNTNTGDTWVLCNGGDGETAWCWMPQYSTATTSKKAR